MKYQPRSYVSLTVLFLICLNTDSLFSWSFRLGPAESNEVSPSIEATADGGFAIAGNTQAGTHSQMDINLIRVRSNGSIRWQRKIGDSQKWDSVSGILQTRNGEFLITGNRMTPGREYDAYIALFSAGGNSLWQKTIGGTFWDGATTAEQTTDGGFIVAGYYGRVTESIRHSDAWFIKLNPQGEVEWQRTYAIQDEYIWSVHQTHDGGFIAAGQTLLPGWIQNDDWWIAKLNPDGKIQWQKAIKSQNFEICFSIIEKSDGGYIAAGRTGSFGRGGFDIWVISLSGSGRIEWQKTYGGRYDDEAIAIVQTADLNYVVAGNTKSFGAGDSDLWILKIDRNGNVLWQKAIGGIGEDVVSSLAIGKAGLMIAGNSNSFGTRQRDLLIVQMNQKGEIGKTCLSSVDTKATSKVSRAKIVTHPLLSDTPLILVESISLPSLSTTLVPRRTCETSARRAND